MPDAMESTHPSSWMDRLHCIMADVLSSRGNMCGCATIWLDIVDYFILCRTNLIAVSKVLMQPRYVNPLHDDRDSDASSTVLADM